MILPTYSYETCFCMGVRAAHVALLSVVDDSLNPDTRDTCLPGDANGAALSSGRIQRYLSLACQKISRLPS